MPRWPFVLVCCLMFQALFAAGACQAEPIIRLSPHMDGINARLSIRYLEDAGHHYSFEQVQRAPLVSAFKPLPHGRSNLGISSSNFWVRIDVLNPTKLPLSWLLEASYPQWNHVVFYVGKVKVMSSGDFESFVGRPVDAQSNVLPLSTPAGAANQIWVHFSNTLPSIANMQLRLWTPKAFHHHEAFNYMAIGVFAGTGILLLFYSLLIGYSTRMMEYIWYGLYVFAAALTLVTTSGFGSRYLWPGVDWFINFSPVLFVLLMLIFGTQFTRSFLNTPREEIAIDRILNATFALGGATLFFYFLGLRGISLRLLYLYSFISIFYPLIGVREYRKGRYDARYYVAGWSVWSLAMALAMLRHSGFLTEDFITFFSPSMGLFIEVILLSFALVERINRLRDERLENEKLANSLREEKELAERVSQAKTQFLAAASHDLRQPMQAQRMFAETIMARSKGTELADLGSRIIDSQLAMQSMLDVLLDISRLDAGVVEPKPTDVSLHALFSSMVNEFMPLAEKKGLQLYIHWPPKESVVHCDPGLLLSILHNLLGNAIRYTEQGAVMLAARRRKGSWRLEVRDSGVGIAKDRQEEVFEEFRQLNNPERDRSKGLGLGLSIVKRLCSLLDYPIHLYSRPGRGSVFSFDIPRHPGDRAIVYDAKQELNLEALVGVQVLIVDDDRDVLTALQQALRVYGLETRCAGNREEAMHTLDDMQPDIIIVDNRLPEFDSGSAVITALRQQVGREIPAVILTGDIDPDQLHRLRASSVPVLHKPVDLQVLLETIQMMISGNSPG